MVSTKRNAQRFMLHTYFVIFEIKLETTTETSTKTLPDTFYEIKWCQENLEKMFNKSQDLEEQLSLLITVPKNELLLHLKPRAFISL